jgi:uncharacterized lipoprotein YddW (UPF0748 family)
MLSSFLSRFSIVVAALALEPSRAPLRLHQPPAVPREFRAAFATPIWDRGFRDWPSTNDLTPSEQRAELRAMFEHAAAAGLNAIVFHVRLASDAMYPTPHAPWSVFISGKSGKGPDPTYDPLAFAISEAHARGIQLHAWFNPFRAMLPVFAGKASPSHVTKKHPEWIRKYGSQTWIDPGEPAARKWVLDGILDVVRRYDIDAVHIDDYFYPYRESRTITRRVRGKRVRQTVDIQFPDDRTWNKYGKGKGFASRDAWRRANIDGFVESMYREVKEIKPQVLVGISPFGIWRSGVPTGVRGLDAFGEIYADSRKWLAQGWLDYIAPQLYWQVDGYQDRFRALDAWWRRENVKERHVWPSLYTSHVYGARDAWPLSEIRTQVATLRAARATTDESVGHVHFRLGALFANENRLARDLSEVYGDVALVPAFPWLGAQAPGPPLVSVVTSDGPTKVTITPGDSVRVRWWVIQTLGQDGKWISSVRHAGDGQVTAAPVGTNDPSEVAVTAIGVTGVASVPTVIAP